MMSFFKNTSLFLCCWGLHLLCAQNYSLELIYTDAGIHQLPKGITAPHSIYKDSIQLLKAMELFTDELLQYAHYEASIDTLFKKDSTYYAFCHLGPAYRWASLSASSDIPTAWLNKTGYRKRLFNAKAMDIPSWLELQHKLAQQAANSGYPFAQVALDSIQWIDEGELSAQITVDKGPLIFFETLIQEGSLQISQQYLEQHLGFSPGDPYNETVIQNMPLRLKELSFAQMEADPTVEFIGNQAKVKLKLKAKPSNRFNFVIGVLPNSQQTGKLLITGQLDAALENALGKGENIRLAFDQTKAQTQELQLAFQYPFLLDLPFGLDSKFELYRRDTNYIDLNWRLGVQYALKGDREVQAYWSSRTTNVLGIDSSFIAQHQQLPDTLDVNRQAFGVAISLGALDYRHNPRKGWLAKIEGSAGQKEIQKNSDIEDLGFASLYDDLQLRSAQYRLAFEFDKYWPIAQRSVIKTSIQGAAILGKEPILVNEQFRIGGNRILRGFDEQSLFASNYGLASIEYRFLLSTHAYFYAFFDQARIDNKSLNTSLSNTETINWAQGMGAGISFETKSGLFGLSLAFGRQLEQSFDFGAPKVHFGYLSLF